MADGQVGLLDPDGRVVSPREVTSIGTLDLDYIVARVREVVGG